MVRVQATISIVSICSDNLDIHNVHGLCDRLSSVLVVMHISDNVDSLRSVSFFEVMVILQLRVCGFLFSNAQGGFLGELEGMNVSLEGDA